MDSFLCIGRYPQLLKQNKNNTLPGYDPSEVSGIFFWHVNPGISFVGQVESSGAHDR